MNLYVLVEGVRTEMLVYPRWFDHLLPGFTRADNAYDVTDNQYFLFSGEGYPSMLDNHLRNAIAEVNDTGRYRYLLLCMDAEEQSVQERKEEVLAFMADRSIQLAPPAELMLIIQNRCIETWFLGNNKVFKRNPQDVELQKFIHFFNVSKSDPEQMGYMSGYQTHARFHEAYLKRMLAERSLTYSKSNPRAVTDSAYLNELITRADESGHLPTFAAFLACCRKAQAER